MANIYQQVAHVRRVSLYLDLIDHYIEVGLYNAALEYIQRTDKLMSQ